MKLKYKMAMWCMMVGILLLTGCDDSDTWTPGPETEVAYQVYFTNGNPEAEDLDPNETNSYTLTLTRENTAEALALPLVASGDVELFEVPSTVEFAAGEKDAAITVVFKGSETGGNYLCSVGIAAGGYNNPYTSLATTVDIRQRICDWQVYVANLKITDYYGDIFPGSYNVDLERDGDSDRYRLKGFMSNYDLVFGVVENEDVSGQYYIYPENGSSGVDAYGDEIWAFDTELGMASYPLYHDLLGSGYLDNGCIYTGAGYGYTYINFNKRSGYIYGCFYLEDSNGNSDWKYPYLQLSWTASDETELAKNAWGRE